jgi:hypothetical protein
MRISIKLAACIFTEIELHYTAAHLIIQLKIQCIALSISISEKKPLCSEGAKSRWFTKHSRFKLSTFTLISHHGTLFDIR